MRAAVASVPTPAAVAESVAARPGGDATPVRSLLVACRAPCVAHPSAVAGARPSLRNPSPSPTPGRGGPPPQHTHTILVMQGSPVEECHGEQLLQPHHCARPPLPAAHRREGAQIATTGSVHVRNDPRAHRMHRPAPRRPPGFGRRARCGLTSMLRAGPEPSAGAVPAHRALHPWRVHEVHARRIPGVHHAGLPCSG